jgi:hypothetical protein
MTSQDKQFQCFTVDAAQVPWETGSLSLWSLYDMLKAYGFIFCVTANNLSRISLPLHTDKSNGLLTDENKRQLVKLVSDIEVSCKDLDLPVTVAKIWRIANILTNERVAIQEIKGELKHLNEVMQDEVKTKLFLSISPNAAALYTNPHPFGEAVSVAFPSALYDIQEAGKCFACERYTASVFHCMRSVEYIMRVFAWDRRATTVKNGKEYPIDMATWEEIIKALTDEVGKISNWPRTRGEVRTQALEFYNSSMEEFRAMKDAWRNHIMHSRRSYIAEDASQVMEHVKRLSKTLATRISETERTPRVWTKAQLR